MRIHHKIKKLTLSVFSMILTVISKCASIILSLFYLFVEDKQGENKRSLRISSWNAMRAMKAFRISNLRLQE